MSETKGKYRVRAGQSVTVATGEIDERTGRSHQKVYAGGEAVELATEEGDALMAAGVVEKGERRQHDGQTRRLQRQLADAQAQISEQNALLKKAAKKDPELDKALKSIRQRGDNYAARNEPDPVRASASAIAEYDNGPADDSSAADLDLEKETGFKGAGAERASGPVSGPQTGSRNQPSTQDSPNPATGSGKDGGHDPKDKK